MTVHSTYTFSLQPNILHAPSIPNTSEEPTKNIKYNFSYCKYYPYYLLLQSLDFRHGASAQHPQVHP